MDNKKMMVTILIGRGLIEKKFSRYDNAISKYKEVTNHSSWFYQRIINKKKGVETEREERWKVQ